MEEDGGGVIGVGREVECLMEEGVAVVGMVQEGECPLKGGVVMVGEGWLGDRSIVIDGPFGECLTTIELLKGLDCGECWMGGAR